MKKRCVLVLTMVFSLAMVLSFGIIRSTGVKAADPLSVTQMPQSAVVTEGELAYFNVKATGTSLKYSWEYKLAGSNSWTVWTTKTTASISVAYASYRNGMSLRCTVKDAKGSSVITTPVTLTYKKAPATIVTQPQNATVEEKNLAYFSVTAKGAGLKYQWEYMTAGSSSWVTWSSKTTASISVAFASNRNGMKLRCVVTDSSGNKVVSNTVTLTYYRKLAITSQPVSTTVDQGKLAYFSVTATGSKLKYVWEYMEAGTSTWKTWSSKTTASISVAYLESRNNMKLRCQITDVTGNKIYSNEATLKYNIKYPSYIKSGSYGTVTGGNLRVRSEPSTQGSQIGLINSGTTVIVEGKVTFTSDGNVWCFAPAWNGYIAINFLDKINDPKDNVYPTTMEEAMDIVVERLNGKFLTVNQQGCTGSNHKSCDNCEMHKVIASQWLHDLFPEISFDNSQFQQSGSGWTCWGGAQIITYIARELLNGGNAKLTYNRVPNSDSVFSFTKADVTQYAKIGDHLRLNDSHSVVLLGINSDNTVRVIDVNSHQDGTNTRVAVYNRKLNGTMMKIYRTTVK